ncbi:MAG: AIR synthase-related protein [Phycisphaeraceae bacterium]
MTAAPTDPTAPAPHAAKVWRFEVRAAAGQPDPLADRATAEAAEKLPTAASITAAKVFLIEAPLTDDQAQSVAEELLADPINQAAQLGAAPPAEHARVVEVHYKPGVMDPVAESTRDAICEMLPDLDPANVYVATGERYDLVGESDDAALTRFAETALGNPVIQDVYLTPHHPESFPHGSAYEFQLAHVAIRDLDDNALMKLSREGHLFLSLEEMKCIRSYYRDAGREPTDVELETLAQTWSEHCVHKTLKATINYKSLVSPEAGPERSEGPDPIFQNKPNHTINDDGSVTIGNLLKSTVAAATFKLKEDPRISDWLVSVFDDNAGVVKFDDTHGVAIKVETHNHPSAIEPYGGAATGIGGCIRDIMGTGLSAKPIANTDTFCVAHPNHFTTTQAGPERSEGPDQSSNQQPLPQGVLHPKRVLRRVVDGVRDYGNRMGIPTVDGAVYFHDDYLANPLVFAGCVGLIPLDQCFGDPMPGDRIIILGGATGRDGIHGATFSSDELTDTHADEFNHAVQIGNAITEKKTLDVILQARDYVDPDTGEARCLFNAISDCGAGGFSSAVGEMGENVGACVTLETAPLKYQGLSYTEIWISEAQERMPLAVPVENVETLRKLCEAENVPFCDLGYFGYQEDDTPTLKLTYHGQAVGKLAMPFLHDGIPMPTREATWSHTNPKYEATQKEGGPERSEGPDQISIDFPLDQKLLALLAYPNIASKHWVVRQYDHEVQGGSVVKPFVGPQQDGPSDAAVVRPKLGTKKAIALSNGLAPHLSEKANHTNAATDGDSYQMVLHAIDEAVRNAVCVGADPDHIAILDNFCWAKCDDPWQLGTLVRAAEACYDGAIAYQTPFVSGKDSLSNQFTAEDGRLITIPQTMLISALGIVNDADKARTMDAKSPGNALFIVGQTTPCLGGSHLAMLTKTNGGSIPRVDLDAGPRHANAVAQLIDAGLVQSAHDCSDGGLLVAAAEMAFAGRVGLDLDLAGVPATDCQTDHLCFAESPSRYLLEVKPQHVGPLIETLTQQRVPFGQIGTFADHQRLTARRPDEGNVLDIKLDTLRQAWFKPLDW